MGARGCSELGYDKAGKVHCNRHCHRPPHGWVLEIDGLYRLGPRLCLWSRGGGGAAAAARAAAHAAGSDFIADALAGYKAASSWMPRLLTVTYNAPPVPIGIPQPLHTLACHARPHTHAHGFCSGV